MQELINLYYHYCYIAEEALEISEEMYRMYEILKRNLARTIFEDAA